MHRAYRRSRTARAAWRELYNLPHTDPRYLEATEAGIIDDLLEAMYRAGERRRADPREAEMDRYLANPEASQADDAQFEEQMAVGGTLYEAALAFERARRDEGRTAVKVVSVRPGRIGT